MLADALVRWTARLFVACYVGRICIDAARLRDAGSQRSARWLWTVGCLVYLIHVAMAFHFVHGWSHAIAYEHVRQRTFNQTGLDSGVGLYVNYAFGVLWLADTFLWWHRLDWSERRIPYWTVQAIFGFLIVQATVVFGPSFWIPVSIAVAMLLMAVSTSPHTWRNRSRRQESRRRLPP